MLEYDPLSTRWRDDPYPAYARLREEAPVHYSPESDTYSVARYDDVMHVLRTPEVFSSRAMFTMLMNRGQDGPPPLTLGSIGFILRFLARTRTNPLRIINTRNLIAEDGAPHTAMRSIVNRGFSPRRIAAWEPRVRELVEECMAPVKREGRFDLMRDLAVPLPVTIIAEMLGIEPERRADFKHWSDTLIEAISGEQRGDLFEPKFRDAILGLDGYVAKIIRQRRKRPQDDLISVIAAPQEGGSLPTLEAMMFVTLLLVAGNETTTNLIGNTARALLDHPDQLESVASDPSLVPALVEEGLRFDAPIQLLFRTATRETELAGTRIPEGATVVPLLGSANRDESRFPSAGTLDVRRETQGHVGFGFGHHFCLGASLARLEATVTLEALVPELTRLERTGELKMADSFIVRGVREFGLSRAA